MSTRHLSISTHGDYPLKKEWDWSLNCFLVFFGKCSGLALLQLLPGWKLTMRTGRSSVYFLLSLVLVCTNISRWQGMKPLLLSQSSNKDIVWKVSIGAVIGGKRVIQGSGKSTQWDTARCESRSKLRIGRPTENGNISHKGRERGLSILFPLLRFDVIGFSNIYIYIYIQRDWSSTACSRSRLSRASNQFNQAKQVQEMCRCKSVRSAVASELSWSAGFTQ